MMSSTVGVICLSLSTTVFAVRVSTAFGSCQVPWVWVLQLLGLPMASGHTLFQSHHLQVIALFHSEPLRSGEMRFCDVAVQLTKLHLNQCAV